MGRAGGVAGVGQPGRELPARVKLSFNYNDAACACISVEETGGAAGTDLAIIALAVRRTVVPLMSAACDNRMILARSSSTRNSFREPGGDPWSKAANLHYFFRIPCNVPGSALHILDQHMCSRGCRRTLGTHPDRSRGRRGRCGE